MDLELESELELMAKQIKSIRMELIVMFHEIEKIHNILIKAGVEHAEKGPIT